MASNLSVSASFWLPCLVLLVFWIRPAAAFGAGNIPSVSAAEDQRWRHGDIEDTLLKIVISSATGKTFSKMDVKRVYFGNWLRDYSQAVDVGTVKSVSAEAIRILLWVLGFMSFGYGTKEFEVTSDRLGCYRPEEHIDNPKDYADNVDARQYDRRLRGPVDEGRELTIDERTGLKHYIASEDRGITTSAGMVRDLLHRCIELGQRSRGQGPDFYEALRLLGTATHCMEDYSAHSNYVELALIELGNEDVFPHVGRNTKVRVEGVDHSVYPIVTGTFGGVDFLHSVCGEISDKTTQSEISQLESAIGNAENKGSNSQLKELLSKIPSQFLSDKAQASKVDELEQNANAAKMEQMHIEPKDPEVFTQQIGEIVKQIYPVMEFHDELMMSISKFIESMPVLPELIESIQDQISILVFSLLAPFVLPIINQVKAELETGSSEVIASSREKQHIVFNDDDCSDPTHSMLSKDHFTNILNFPAGNVASSVLTWAIPKIVACWDGQADTEDTINCIIEGVFHHPANLSHPNPEVRKGRETMFNAVRQWWDSLEQKGIQDEYRGKLSREGVQNAENHVGDIDADKGHGCCGKPFGIANDLGGSSGSSQPKPVQQIQQATSEALGGGFFGKLVGEAVGNVAGDFLGGGKKKSEKHGDDNSGGYGQAQYNQSQYSSSGRRDDYSRQEQHSQGGSYGYQQSTETSSYGGSGGYGRQESGSHYRSDDRPDDYGSQGQRYNEDKKKHSKKHGSEDEDSGDDYEKRMRKEQKKREKEEKKHKKYGSGNEDSEDEGYKRRSGEHKRKSKSPERRSHGNEYGRQESSGYGQDSYSSRQESSGYGGDSYNSGGGYGSQQSSGYGRQESSGYGRQESSGYGREESSGYGRQESSGYGREESSGYGRQENSSYGRQETSGYGREESSGYDRQDSSGYGRQESSGYGGREEESEYGRRDEDEYGQSRRQYGGGYGDRSEGYGGRY